MEPTGAAVMGEWWEKDQHAIPPAPSVVDREQKPVLYDHKGRPLVREKRVGFRPPESAPEAPPRTDRRRVR